MLQVSDSGWIIPVPWRNFATAIASSGAVATEDRTGLPMEEAMASLDPTTWGGNPWFPGAFTLW